MQRFKTEKSPLTAVSLVDSPPIDRLLPPPGYNFPAITHPDSSHPLSSTLAPSLELSRSSNPLSPAMKAVEAVEKILNYNFTNKSLLKDALTLSSHSYERLEFLGDMAIGLAVTNHLYLVYPELEPHELSLLRMANVSNHKFARVTLHNGLYQHLQHKSPCLDTKVREFAEAVAKEDGPPAYGELVKGPKFLADLFEAVVGAVYLDMNFDLQRLWVIFRGLLEPIFTLDDLEQQCRPVSTLYYVCHKHKKRIGIRYSKDGKNNIAGVYLDDEFIASGRAENKHIAKSIAAKEALRKLPESMRIDTNIDEYSQEIAKQTLNEICSKKNWSKPIYSVEEGSLKGETFVCSVKVKISSEVGTLYMKGDKKSRKKEAESSSAYHMIRALKDSDYL